jgi:hypothetical protein
MIDARVAQIQRIGQRGTCRRRVDAHMKSLGMVGLKTNFNIAQALTPAKLRESHDAKQIRATKSMHSRIALVQFNDAIEGLPRHKLHHLCKLGLAHIHAALSVVESRKHRKRVPRNSNRGHPKDFINRAYQATCTLQI